MSYSPAFVLLLSEIRERLTIGASGVPDTSIVLDLATQWPLDLVDRTWGALCELALTPKDKAEALEALAGRLPAIEGLNRIREAGRADSSLLPYFQNSQTADLEGEQSAARHTKNGLSRTSLRWQVAQLPSLIEQRLLFEKILEILIGCVKRKLSESGLAALLQARPELFRVRSPLHHQSPSTIAEVDIRRWTETAPDPNAGDGPDDELPQSGLPTQMPASYSVEAADVENLDPSAAPEMEPAVVSTGFAPQDEPGQPLSPQQPLCPGGQFYFWTQIGEQVAQSIELQTVSIPKEYAQVGARLKVVLFAFPGELILDPAACIGELQVGENGTATVIQQPTEIPNTSLSKQRLFFPVRVAETANIGATLSLRCSIYCNQVLLQSRLVSVEVGESITDSDVPSAENDRAVLRSLLDYSIAERLGDASSLHRITPHKLSVLLNENNDGTHSFRFFGAESGKDIRSDATLDADTLRSHVRRARGALRKVAWGDEEAYKGGSGSQTYRYAEQPRGKLLAQLLEDLIPLAVSGSRFYVGIVRSLAGSTAASYQLQELMRTPGFVQIASKVTARHIVPAALLYDQPLDDGQPASAYRICPAFRAALDSPKPLEESDCFSGHCPSYDQDTVICPSGFWGFRHHLGMPLTGPNCVEPQPQITYDQAPHLSVGVSLELREFAMHEKVLRGLRKDLVWQCEASAPAIFQMMREGQSHVVYFYCHGGVIRDMPYLEVGRTDVITPSSLFRKHICWQDPRPLVFLNGCHTTALDPEQVMDLVTEFVEIGQASGVIGTEITIFEPLARAFAEDCLGRFLAGQPIGQAVRGARLGLLKSCNPLGLAYDPFVLATVRLTKKGT